MAQLVEILLVDDNPVDTRIMQDALENARVANRLHSAPDGIQAMAMLRREGAFKDTPRPNLILLDLDMPRMGGLDVLAEIKADPELRSIPTIILSGSMKESDVARAYELHANGFVFKPADLDDLVAVVGGIEQYWTGIAKLAAPASA